MANSTISPMKHIKITNYTTKDWLKQVAAMMAMVVIVQMLFRSLKDEEWMHAAGHLIGFVGWTLIYFRIMKNLKKKNPQDQI